MGAIQEIEEGGQRRYRCRVGHAYSPEDMLGDKAHAVEDTLWVALQTLQERAQMLATMARDDRAHGRWGPPPRTWRLHNWCFWWTTIRWRGPR